MCSYLRACTTPQGLIVTALIMWQCICNGAAIKCFVCDSSDNPSCADLKSNSSIVPEECTLDKMRSLDTWLFELNKFAYFDTGVIKSPLMNCQKVVARDPNTSKMVTARFCQLDTGDSDACAILRSKMRISTDGSYGQSSGGSGGSSNNARRGKNAQDSSEEEEQFHCSICRTDCCNGTITLTGNALAVLAMMTLLIMQRHSVW